MIYDERKAKFSNLTVALIALCVVFIVISVVPIAETVKTTNSCDALTKLQFSATWVNSQTINQPANVYTQYTTTANYAGYVYVNIEASTTNNTYVEVVWSYKGINYDNTISVGTDGTAVFPVLPSSVRVNVGNTNQLGGATETVTITYHY